MQIAGNIQEWLFVYCYEIQKDVPMREKCIPYIENITKCHKEFLTNLVNVVFVGLSKTYIQYQTLFKQKC